MLFCNKLVLNVTLQSEVNQETDRFLAPNMRPIADLRGSTFVQRSQQCSRESV